MVHLYPLDRLRLQRGAEHLHTPDAHTDRGRAARLTALPAATLDRLADAELQHGHHGAAERLAAMAAELRGRAL